MTISVFVNTLGGHTLSVCAAVGRFALFVNTSFKAFIFSRFKYIQCLLMIESMGIGSLPIVILTGFFTGMVFALQSYIGFERVGGEQFIGAVVALGVIRELGPVLTGLMVIGRCGSSIAAQLGSMKITEQIDALLTLRINPYQYLIVPRIISGIFIMPLLALFSMVCAIGGGYIVCHYMLALSADDYWGSIRAYVELKDIIGGLIKSAVFGLIFTLIACYYGMKTSGGARGVGAATTQSVVTASISMLICNYFLTKLLEHL